MATVVAAMVSLALVAVLWVAVQLGAAVITRHRAEGAADLAALAAAAHAVRGESYACRQASWVVEKMQATMTSCRLSGWESRLHVRLRPPGLSAAFGPVRARARAGPVAIAEVRGQQR